MKHWLQSSLNPDSAFIYWKGERGILECQRCLSVALIANISVQLCFHCSELVKVPLKGPLWWMDCAFMAVCSRVCTSASIAPVPVSSFRLCGLVIKPTGATLPMMRKKKPMHTKQVGEFWSDIGRSIGRWPDNRFSFSSHHQSRATIKSLWVLLHLTLSKAYVHLSCLHSEKKIYCPKIQSKHPCPLLRYKAFKQNHLSGFFRLYFSQPFVTSNMFLWCFRHIFLMFYTPYNLLCAAKPILLADIIDGA